MERGETVASGGLHGVASERRGLVLRTAVDRVARWFAENPCADAVTTSFSFALPPERVWKMLRFYEEIPTRPSALLRLLLPIPVRSEGQKGQPGAAIQCTYEGGSLVKRITVAEPPHLLSFEVVEQQLGIEHCISVGEGSYEIRGSGSGCEVLLTTRYRGHLRPRFLWRPLERALAHAVHLHILRGMQH